MNGKLDREDRNWLITGASIIILMLVLGNGCNFHCNIRSTPTGEIE
jgi:hypothetical protein